MADKRKPAEKPSKNRTNASHRDTKAVLNDDPGLSKEPDLSHRSGKSAVEGGQNEYEGEPHYGYGSDQGQSQQGKRKPGTTNWGQRMGQPPPAPTGGRPM